MIDFEVANGGFGRTGVLSKHIRYEPRKRVRTKERRSDSNASGKEKEPQKEQENTEAKAPDTNKKILGMRPKTFYAVVIIGVIAVAAIYFTKKKGVDSELGVE